jgi:hypothetical protein
MPSAAHHHQTADALTHLPAPTHPEAAAAVAAAAAGVGGGEGPSCEAAAAAAAASVVEVPPEDVVVSCKGVLSVYRLETGKVRPNSSLLRLGQRACYHCSSTCWVSALPS